MALRHAVLAALLDGELSGYELAKAFDLGVANFWHARPQQVYAELTRLEGDGFVAGREVVQEAGPTSVCSASPTPASRSCRASRPPPRNPPSSATTCSSKCRPPTMWTPGP